MQPIHRDDPGEVPSFGHRLSCLLDGETDGLSAEDACAAWRDQSECRSTWHHWHLIGDVMRSTELASTPGRDAAFLVRFRERLAAEPPLPAPETTPQPEVRRVRSNWTLPVAVAAGFVAVAGVVVTVRVQEAAPVPAVASASSGVPAASVVASGVAGGVLVRASSGEVRGSVSEPETAMLRDAEVDRYFRAHRGVTVSPAMPGGAPRNVDTIVQR